MNDNSTSNNTKRLHLINEEIKFDSVLLVSPEDGNKVVSIEEALSIARSKDLDLVLISDSSNPPIVKILDYGKFLYEIKKKKKGHNKSASKVKSVTIKPQISDHDMGWKAEQTVEWLKSGDKVQLVIKAPGRMCERMDLINEVYKNFSKLVEKYGKSKTELKKISKIRYSTFLIPVGNK